MASPSVWLMGIMVLALLETPAARAVNCKFLLGLLYPCQPFFLNQTLEPSVECCFGAYGVACVAESPDTMKSACRCLKSAGKKHPVPIPIATQLFSDCDIPFNMTIDPNINCSKYICLPLHLINFHFNILNP